MMIPSTSPMTSYVNSTPCPHNERVITFDGGGVLRGYAGTIHEELISKAMEPIGVHLFLDTSWIPEYFIYSTGGRVFEKIGASMDEIIMFKIYDQKAPTMLEDFKLLISYLHEELKEGRRVNVSCIGGHGRTGLILAVLYGLMHPEEKEPVTKLREIYCTKAVESWEQKAFVHSFLGLEPPVKDIGLCGKCHQQPRMENDIWCSGCDKEWKERVHDGRIITYPPSSPISKRGISGYYCTECWMRQSLPNNVLCGQCLILKTQASPVSEDAVPGQDGDEEVIEGLTRRELKNMMRCVKTAKPAMSLSKIKELIKSGWDKPLSKQTEEEFEVYCIIEEEYYGTGTLPSDVEGDETKDMVVGEVIEVDQFDPATLQKEFDDYKE